MEGLPPRQKRFCIEYLKDWNGTRSYMAAFRRKDKTTGRWIIPQEETAAVEASKLIRNPKVKAEIDRLTDELFADEKARLKWFVLNELQKIAGSNITDVLSVQDQNVSVNNTEDLPDHVKRSIEQITESKNKYGGSISVKMHSKTKALELLGRCAGMFDDKLDVTGSIQTSVDPEDRLEAYRALKAKAEKNLQPDVDNTTV